MKALLTIVFSFFCIFLFGQAQKNNEASYDLTISFKPAAIRILNDTGTIAISIVNYGLQRITYINVKAGNYRVQISGQGQLTTYKNNIIVKEGQKLSLNFKIDGPCLYDHPADYVPICPKNHTDSIIPIVYGLVATRGDSFIINKKEIKVKYAGCIMTGCDPKFYCKEHDIEF